MANILQQVITYNESNLALLQNSFAWIAKSNNRYKHFDQDITKNLGDTVSFDLPPRFTTNNSLVIAFQDADQRVQNLTVDNEVSTAYQFTAQEFIFNAREYMDKFGRSAVAEIGSQIESNVAELAETNTYRFFGDGVTQISTYLQLANALAFFRNYGAAKNNTCGILSDLTYPGIVNSGLGQFTLDRGNREAMSWEIGRFSNAEWYQSNLLKTHIAGLDGNAATTLTVVSVLKDANDAVIQITFGGSAAAPGTTAIHAYDKFQFNDGVGALPNMRYRTFIGHQVSQNPVQFRATADANADGAAQVVVDIYPPLKASAGNTQNTNNEIAAGMQVSILPDHRCGIIMAGDPLFLAMPRLPEEVPFPTAVANDPDTGLSLRQYYGSLFGQNQRGMVHDAIWGRTLVDEYAMCVALPI
jgi:hypothetical protein